MENKDYLSEIFNQEDKESLQQYQIMNFKNIPQLLQTFRKDENTKKYPLTLENISDIFQFLKSSFRTFRINIIYFNKYSNNQLYEIFIDFYLNNDYSSEELDDLCLQIIDILINNIDISKSILDSVIEKFANYFYSLEEPTPSYVYLSKLLKLLNHLYGVDLNIKKPKHYYYFSGLEKYERNFINYPLENPNQTMSITLWFKACNNQKGEILSLTNSKYNSIIRLEIEKNELCLIHRQNNYIIKTDFYSNDFNSLSFYIKFSKKKISVALYLNEKLVLKEQSIQDTEDNINANLLLLGKNFFGEMTSILIGKSIINFEDYKQLSLTFPFGLINEKDIINFNNEFSKVALNLRSIHLPYGGKFNLYNNKKVDLIFGENTGVNIYHSFQKKINLLGGMNIILPIIELLYLNIQLCIEHKDLYYLFFEIILTILKYKKKNIQNAINSKFFMILSIFIEKMPEELFDKKIHQIIIDLAINIFFYHNTIPLYLDYCNYVLLNEKIVFKFIASEQVDCWDQIYKYYEQGEKFALPINKLITIITCNDNKYSTGNEICCKKHYECYLKEYKPKGIKIMEPDFDTKTENLFLLLKSIILTDKNKEKNYKDIANILPFNNSPCLTGKILEFIIEQFTKKGENKEKEKECKKVKEIIFNLFKSEEYKIILFNLLFNEFLDIKFSVIKLVFLLYEYNKKKFDFSFKFIKENIIPKSTTVNFRYNNFSPLPEDTYSLAEHCINKILKMNTITCYEHDNILCYSVFNASYLSEFYNKFINLFIEFLVKNNEKSEEILDILLYLCKNLNIETTLTLFNQLNLFDAKNINLQKKVFTFIPMLNYLFETLTYYSLYKNSVYESAYKLIINIVFKVKDKKLKLLIIEYIIKYYSIMKNKDSIQPNNNLNILISKTLTRFLNEIAQEYLTVEKLEKEKDFVIELTSILFDYITIFNQDKKLYKVFTTKTKDKYIFSSFSGVSLICPFIQGLNIREYESNLKNPKLEQQWWDYDIVVKILKLFQNEFNISSSFLKDKDIKTTLDKVLYIYDNLIFKDEISDKNFGKIKDSLYIGAESEKNNPLIKIILYLYMLSLNLCKDEEEYENLLKHFVEYNEFIILVSTKIPQSTNTQEQNKKELNTDTIAFTLMFLFDNINQPNEFISKNEKIKNLIISSFNELISLCLYIYIMRIPVVKTGIIKGMFKKVRSSFIKATPLNLTPPFELISEFLVKVENKENEIVNKIIRENEKNFLDFYSILTKNEAMLNNFNQNCQQYMNKKFAKYINFDLLINLSKNRLIEDTTNNKFKPKDEKYNIDFNTIKNDIIPILTKVKMSSTEYINYSYQTQRAKRNAYKSLKKNLFIWNGAWSNKELFYKNKNRLKYKLYNHLTKSLVRPFLVPLLDLKYYTPNFTKYNPDNIFNKNDLSIPLYKDLVLDIDKIINTYEKKTEDYQYIDNSDKEEQFQAIKYECCFVKPTHHIKGIFLCSEKGIQFKVFLNQKTLTNDINDTDTSRQEQDIDYDNTRHTCYGSYFVEHPKNKDNLYFNFSFEQIKYMFKRIYYYHQTGLEIYTVNNRSYYFNFKKASVRNEIFDKISPHLKSNKLNVDNIITKWKKYQVSNIELLMWLNVFGGRSYNDISQYPVFPWIISDYKRDKIKESDLTSDKTLFRDLSLPLGMIPDNDKGERRDSYILNLKSTTTFYKDQDKSEEKKDYALFESPYNYGTHYSNPFYVAHYLTRIYPFSYIMIELQGNKFDDPDRIFISMYNSYLGATTQKGDVRELIPEVYTIPEIFYNINNFDLGTRRNKTKVSDVECPPWSDNDPYKFLTYLNLAFESDEVSSNIGYWIDLIFGFKQRGKEAEKYNNIYMHNSYPDLVDIENMSIEKKRYYYRFVEFGSCPKQLFKKPFDKKESYSGFKQIIDKDVSVITIELKNNKKEKENKEDKNEKIDIIELIKENTNIQKYFPLAKKGAKLFYSNYNGIHLSQKKINEDTYRYDQTLLIYGFGIQFEKYFIGNNLITDDPPCIMYGEGRFLLEGGYLDGLMLLTDFNVNSCEKIYNPNDKSPVTCIVINKEENIVIVGNNIGIIYAYEVKDITYLLIKKIQYNHKAINYLFLSDELNAFASCSEDKYVNIYSLPNCNIIHSLEIEEPEFVLLSGKPLPVCVIYSKKNQKLLVYSVNGHFINEVKVDNKPQYPIIYTNKHFRDYLIYSIRGSIYIRSLPNLELYNTIKLNPNKNLDLNNIYLQFYRNKNGNEQLYALDQSIQTLYIIGDSEN